MPRSLHFDLRSRVLSAIDGGLSCRQAAAHFGVSASSAIRWAALRRAGGDGRAKPQGGDRLSSRTEAHADRIRAALAEAPDLNPGRAEGALGRRRCRGQPHGAVALLPPARHHAQKSVHAAEQDRPDVERAGQAWFDGQFDLDPERLIFIDETGTSTKMARPHGRACSVQWLHMGVPHGHWKTTTLTAGLSLRGIVAPFMLDGAVDRLAFETYVARVLVPELRPGDVVIMDNLPAHRGPRVAALIEAVGARVLHLQPYSPDFNPIENAIAKLKALLRKAAERTVAGLWAAIGRLVDLITLAECANMFAAAGYGAT